MESLFHYLAGLACRRGHFILLISLLVTLLCAYPVYRLTRRLETDIAALLPQDYPSVRTLEQIKKKVRGTENLVVLIEGAPFESAARFAEDLARELEKQEYRGYVKYVDYRRDVEFFRKNALLYMDLEDLEKIRDRVEERVEQEKLKRSPLYVSLGDEEEDGKLEFGDIEKKYEKERDTETYYTNPEHTIVAVTVAAAGTASNLGFGRAMEKTVKKAVERLNPAAYHPGMVVEYGGSFRTKIDEYEIIRNDITSSLAYGIAGIMLLLTLYFRQPLAAVFVVLPLVMGLTWAFAIAYAAIGNLNTITGFLFVVLFGLGIDFGIHLFARYLEDRMAGMSAEQSVEQMLRQTGRAMLTAGMTTVAAFYALLITDFKGFSEFGLIVGTGIVTSMLAMVTVLPSCLILADRDLGLIRMRPVWGHGPVQEKGGFPWAWPVLLTGMALTLYLGAHLNDVDFEYDFGKLRANLPATRAIKAKIDSVSDSRLSTSPSVVLASSKEELDEIVRAVEARMALPDSTPTIETVRTLWSALPQRQEEKLEVMAQIRGQVEEADGLLEEAQRAKVEELRPLLEAHPLQIGDLPQNLRRRFTSADGNLTYFAFIYPKVQLKDGKNAMAFAEDSQVIRTESGKTFYSSSSSIIFADMLRIMLRDSRTAVGVTALVVVLIVLMDFRSLRATLLVLVPLGCGIVWMIGSMYLFTMKLNFYNMVVLPSVIGMGIDNGVHLYHRYQEEGPGSLRKVLRHTGGAMLGCVLTTMVGFAGLTMARHPGLNSIGVLALIGLGACFLAAVTVLPALLQVLEDRKKG